ncbi:hypothetical protein R1flu_012802 [Riccia fluitans]|uniref:Uncharacterized protein n=1 Tax=Riccia fluitans TaxID=41844 RepID=A0ABD1ZCP1_9MARC
MATPPRSNSGPVSMEKEHFQSVTSPRVNVYLQPGPQRKPNKKRKSTSSDNMAKTIKEFVDVHKEILKEKKKQEMEKIKLMKESIQLRRIELEAQCQFQSSHHPN